MSLRSWFKAKTEMKERGHRSSLCIYDTFHVNWFTVWQNGVQLLCDGDKMSQMNLNKKVFHRNHFPMQEKIKPFHLTSDTVRLSELSSNAHTAHK